MQVGRGVVARGVGGQQRLAAHLRQHLRPEEAALRRTAQLKGLAAGARAGHIVPALGLALAVRDEAHGEALARLVERAHADLARTELGARCGANTEKSRTNAVDT